MASLNETNSTIDQFSIPAASLAALISAINQGDVPSSRAVEVFDQMRTGRHTVPRAMQALGIEQVDESDLEALCMSLVEANPRVVADVQAGRLQAIGALVGQAKKNNPNVDPARVKQICLDLISKR
jgi:aspartyl-tRNA(Asn)/glutamyl-tRNA(Gln) amidotransferase subunit B